MNHQDNMAHANEHEDHAQAMLIAGFETPNYEFMCAARTRAEAIALFRKAWLIHCGWTGADKSYFSPDDVWTAPIAPGQVLRDGHRIL